MTKAEPSNTLLKLARSLFEEDSGAQEEFVQNILAGKSARPAIIWTKEKPSPLPFTCDELLAGIDWVSAVSPDARVGAHPLHEQGHYYCLDSSSIFTASVLLAAVAELREPAILDLCASPGGKSIFAGRAFRTTNMVCNEVIKKRLGQLSSNLKRCGFSEALMTSRDPSVFVKDGARFDVVIVDAPCSGQSLIARGEDSPGCFHPATMNMNSNRQKRILANAAQVVSPSGYLAYITCTYCEAENEKVVKWLQKKFRSFVPVEVPHLKNLQSHLADFPCYRVWPGKGCGAGGFACLLKRE